MMDLTSRAPWIGLLAAGGLLLTLGCGGTTFRGPARQPDPAFAFVNVAPDAGPLDFYVDDELVSTNLGFGTISPSFRRFEFKDDQNGLRSIAVFPTGGDVDYDRIAETFARDTETTFVAIGLVNAQGDLQRRIRLINIDTPIEVVAGNRARLFVLNALVPALGDDPAPINFQSPGDNPQFIARDLGFAQFQTLDVDSGVQSFEARRADVEGTNIYASANVILDPGGLYLAVATGVVGEQGELRPRLVFLKLPNLPTAPR